MLDTGSNKLEIVNTVTCLKRPLTEEGKIGFADYYYCLMQVKSIAECHGAFYSTLTCIKLPFGCKTFVLSIFEWPLKTGFAVF